MQQKNLDPTKKTLQFLVNLSKLDTKSRFGFRFFWKKCYFSLDSSLSLRFFAKHQFNNFMLYIDTNNVYVPSVLAEF